MEWEVRCWTRVLRRSIGWRRTAEVMPEERPARKWKVDFGDVLRAPSDMVALGGSDLRGSRVGCVPGPRFFSQRWLRCQEVVA